MKELTGNVTRRTGTVKALAFGLALAIASLSATVTASAAGTTITVAKDGFSFTLPSTWIQIPLSKNALSSAYDEVSKRDPSLKNILSKDVTSALKTGTKALVVGPVENGFLSNVSVYVASSKSLPSGKAFLSGMGTQLEETYPGYKFRDLKISIKRLAMGSVVNATYRPPTSLKSTGYIDQIFIDHKTHYEIVTVTTSSLTTDKKVLKELAGSWVWS